jgi:hypothetical protein
METSKEDIIDACEWPRHWAAVDALKEALAI